VDREHPSYSELITVEAVPPLPATAAQLLLIAANPDAEVDDLVAVIERDPPLTARLIGIANSAFYAPRVPVLNLREAIIRVLGLNIVRNIAFGMSLTGGLSCRHCPRFDLTRYWVTALGTADLCSGLVRAADIADLPDPDAAYLVGLLHNLGELLLVHLWPRQMDEAFRRLEEQPEQTLEQLERELIGLDHWAAGAFLARHWQLPAVVGDTIAGLAEPDKEGGEPLVGLLLAARRWLLVALSGRAVPLHAEGVDAGYCEYRSTAFLERFDKLRNLAATIA